MNIGLLILEFIIFGVLIGGPLIAFMTYRRMRVKQQRLSWEANQRYTTLEVLVPKNNEKSPLAAEQMLASLHGIYREKEQYQYQMSFEIASYDQLIHFFLHVPTHLKDFIEGQMYAQYPTIEIREAEDYTRRDLAGQVVASAQMKLTKPYVYPIKTFQSFDVDPMSAITAVLGKTQPGEQAWVQIVMRPVSDDWQLKGISYASSRRAGESTSKPPQWQQTIGSIFGFLARIVRLFMNSEAEAAAKPSAPPKLAAPEEAAMKGIETKVTKLGYETIIRIVAIGSDDITTRSRIEGLTGAYKQFNTTNLNGFKTSDIHVGPETLEDYRQRTFTGGDILNIEELASLYHFPALSVETPNIAWAGSKKGEPPPNLPYEGQVAPEELTVFAETDFRGVNRRFGMLRDDRRLHMYAIGKTGTGKSTLLENMIIDDIQKGKGVAVVDPHGDLVDHVLNFVPDHRINDVIYFNPADRDFSIGFNLLESPDPALKNIAASGLMSIFTKLWANVWSARMEYILRNAVLALLEYPGATFLEVMKLLVDPKFRKKVLAEVKDPVIRDFFINEFEKYDPKFRTEAIAPIQNKVGQFLSSDTIRNIVGQQKSAFDIRKAMDERKIILFDLSTGKIGEDNAALLGAMMITKIQLAAMTRVDILEKDRVDFYLYVDEFQNFATESFAKVLSEARKYHLNLVLTNQYIAQMSEEVAKAIFGNIGTLVAFRVGSGDATLLARELEPVFDGNDLVNLDRFHVYLKMSIGGVTRPAFSAKTLPPFKGANDNREKIVEASRARYARLSSDVEREIGERSEADSGGGHTDDFGPRGGSTSAPEEKKGPRYRRLGKSADGIVWYGTDEVAAPVPALPVGETSTPAVPASEPVPPVVTQHEPLPDTEVSTTTLPVESNSKPQPTEKPTIKQIEQEIESLETELAKNHTNASVNEVSKPQVINAEPSAPPMQKQERRRLLQLPAEENNEVVPAPPQPVKPDTDSLLSIHELNDDSAEDILPIDEA